MNHNIKPGVAVVDQVQVILKLAKKEKNLLYQLLMLLVQVVLTEF